MTPSRERKQALLGYFHISFQYFNIDFILIFQLPFFSYSRGTFSNPYFMSSALLFFIIGPIPVGLSQPLI